jgi:predicted permease
MSDLARPLRHAARRLARTPLFTSAALVTLAVGIGANSAIFSVVNGVLLKPLPFEDADELVALWHEAPGLGFEILNQGPATYLTYRADIRVLEDVAMWDNSTLSVTGLEQPEEVAGLRVTDAFLPLLRVEPQIGRRFTAEDDAPEAALTVMLSHGYWERAFGADPAAVGRTLTMDGRAWEVIGVLPEGFRFLRYRPDVVYTFRLDPAQVHMGNFSYQAIGRLGPGATIEQVAAEVSRLIPVAAERYPGPVTLSMMEQARFAPLIRPLKEDVVGDVRRVLWVLLGTVGMVLLIACANVANLFLVRAEGRVKDVAVRTALGAGRGHVAGQFLGESVLLGLVGGVVGLVLAWVGLRALLAMAPALPRLEEITLDPAVLAFTAGVSVLAGLLFGLFPLLRYGRPNLVGSLKEGGRGGSAGRDRHRARGALVVAQVALALVLLVGSGLMIRSFQALRSVEPGFRAPHDVLTFRVSIPGAVVEDDEEVLLAWQEITRRLEAIPGVESVGGSSSVTMDGWDSNDPLFIEDVPVEPGQLPPIRRFKWVLPNYHETMGNRLVAGRTLTWADLHDRNRVAVITEDIAREYWGDPARAVGERVGSGAVNGAEVVWREVVGVVGNVRDDGVDQPTVPVVYWPAAMDAWWDGNPTVQRWLAFVVRTEGASLDGLLPRVQQAVWGVNPNLPLANVRTVDELLADSMERTSFTLVMLGIAAGVALLLGAVGIYGVISYSVSQRMREIGVRMALGARAEDVSRMVVRQGLVLAALGVGIGLAAALALSRVLGSLLHGVEPMDPLTYAVVSATLAGVALLASWLPARRAAAMDPALTLRQE